MTTELHRAHPFSATWSAAQGCPICAQPVRHFCTKHQQGHDWRINRCSACGFGYVENRPTPELLNEVYAQSTAHLEWDPAAQSSASHDERPDALDFARRLRRHVPPRGRLLDIGCGDGAFSSQAAKLGLRPILLDLDPRVRQIAHKIPGAEAHICTFEEFSAAHATPQDRVQLIIMSQVLEHALDPLDWLRRAHALLTHDGVLGIAVPNFGGIYRALGTRDPFLTPPIHLNFFTAEALRQALAKCGFDVLEVSSASRLNLGRHRGLARAVAQTVWNGSAWVLDRTAAGVILNVFARPRAR